MEKSRGYQRTDQQVLLDELNYALPNNQFEIDRKNEVWVFGYPSGIKYDSEKSLEENVKSSVKAMHSFLIQSV
jgi:hypothetical protein